TLSDSVSPCLGNAHASLLNNHGAITTGGRLFEAYVRMDVLEYLAELHLVVKQTGHTRFLSDKQLREIDNF
ncbi:MAG: class II aldolase/adducin family protein, partial [Bacteroidales bacterium]